jgi:hypothetical protein
MINVAYTATAFSIFYIHRIIVEFTHASLVTESGSGSRMRVSWGRGGVFYTRRWGHPLLPPEHLPEVVKHQITGLGYRSEKNTIQPSIDAIKKS